MRKVELRAAFHDSVIRPLEDIEEKIRGFNIDGA